jgi:transposase
MPENLTTDSPPVHPPGYTRGRADDVLALIAQGHSLADAALECGLRASTFEAWLANDVDDLADRYEQATGQRPPGRPPKFKPEYVQIAATMCRMGATNADLAEAFKVTTRTIINWQMRYEEFFHSTKTGKEPADERVKRSLYERAVGYGYNAVKIFQFQGQPVVVPYVEFVPPDVTAAIFWLKNRCPDEWKDRVTQESSGEIHITIDAADAAY